VSETTSNTTGLEPITATVTVHCERGHAFDVFTNAVGSWWPVPGHSIGGQAQVADVVLEPRIGGRFFERWHDGHECTWGEVLVWEPPSRLVVSWQPNPDSPAATEVEVGFEEAGPSTTTVRLVHRGWERLGAIAAERRSNYEANWPGVLARFVGRAADPACSRAFARQTNQLVWALLGTDDRAAGDDERMVHAAHASAHHWSLVGEPVNHARAEWLVSHVYAVLGRPEPARHHAVRSLEICEASSIGDFDLAYAYEGMARAAAVAGDAVTAATWRERAVGAGTAIALLAEGFDMLEEDYEEESFFAAVRRGYWQAAESSATRRIGQALIDKLEF
jgi:uncharacterized protein YndB with AHSA1/START domain